MAEGSLIYLGKNGTIKIDKRGRPQLFQWPSLVGTGNSEKTNYGAVTIRIEGETNHHDIHNQNNNSREQGVHYSLRPSSHALSTSLAVQRGTSIPVEVAGASKGITQRNGVIVMPVQHTSTISIENAMHQHLQQEQQRNLQKIQQLNLSQQHQHHQVQDGLDGGPKGGPNSPPIQTKAIIHNRQSDGYSSNETTHRGVTSHCEPSTYNPEDHIYSEIHPGKLKRTVSTRSSDGTEDGSEFSFETLSESESEVIPTRVAVLASVDTVILVQATCDNEPTCESPLLFDKMAEITKACLAYFRKLTSDKMRLNSTALGHIKLGDQRPVSDHVEDLQKGLSDAIRVTAVGRKASSKKFVGTFINDPCKDGTRGPVSIGKTGVIVVLQGFNRLAPLKEFSDQLCHHIALFKPVEMGEGGRTRPQHEHVKESRAKSVGLLDQAFLYDNTITVWEASRRAFIDIADFILLG